MDIGPPRRRGHRHRALGALAVDRAAQRFEDRPYLDILELDAGELLDPAEIERDGARIGRRFARHPRLRRRAAAEFEDHIGREIEARHDGGGIDAALEAVARVGLEASLAAGCRRPQRIEVSAFDEDGRGCFRRARCFAAHDAAEAKHGRVVGDHAHGVVDRVLLSVETVERFAGLTQPRADGAPELLRVVDMKWAATIDRDVVRHVDEGVDGAQADGGQPVLQPRRRRAVLDAGDDAAGKRRAGGGGVLGERELDVDGALGLAFDGTERWLRLELAEAGGCQIARDAAHARAVRAVGREFHLDDRVRQSRHIDIARADLTCEARVEIEDAVAFRGEFEFGRRAQHAVRDDAAHRLLLQRDLRAGNIGAERGEHGQHAHARVRRPADDFHQRLARRDLDLAHAQPVGIGVLLGVDDTRNGECAKLGTRVLYPFDLKADGRQLGVDRLQGGGRVEMVFEPGQREFHRWVSGEQENQAPV